LSNTVDSATNNNLSRSSNTSHLHALWIRFKKSYTSQQSTIDQRSSSICGI